MLKILPIKILSLLHLFLLCCLSILLSTNLNAQTVEKVKGTKALLSMGMENYQVGEELVSLTVDGRKVGLMRVAQVRGDRAIADILKGTVSVGMSVQQRQPPKQRFPDEPDMSEIQSRKNVKLKNSYGGLFGYSMDTMNISSTTSMTLTGNTMKLKGFFDYIWSDDLTARLSGGLDGFTVANGAANMTIQYLAFDGSMHWNLYKNKMSRGFLNAGYSFQLPMSSTNNIGITATTNNVIFFGGGLNVPISNKSYLPFYFHYNYIFPSTGITLNSMEFGIGYGFN